MTNDTRVLQLKSSIDYDSLGDHLQQIASFSISKYEDSNKRTFSQDEREQLQVNIAQALKQDIDELELKQYEYQKRAFDEAAMTLEDVVTAEENRMEFKRAMSSDILQDNLKDIAAYTVEKYEFTNNCTLSEDLNEKAQATIVNALQQYADMLLVRRQRFLNSLFAKAREIVEKGG